MNEREIVEAIQEIHAGLLETMDDRLNNPTPDKHGGYILGLTDMAVKLSQRIARG